MKNISTICFFFLLAIVACNKDSNELPNPSYKLTKSLTKTAKLFGKDMLEVTFVRSPNVKEKNSAILIQNVSGDDLTSVRIVVEVCSDPTNFDNCSRQFVIEKTEGLKKGITWTQKYEEDSFFETGAITNVYILKAGDREFRLQDKTLLSGSYTLNNVFIKNALSASLGSGQAKGYVLADGEIVFRLRTINAADGIPVYFNISGSLGSDDVLTGKIVSGAGTTGAGSAFRSSNITSQKMVTLSLTTPINDIKTLQMTLN